MNRRSKFPIRKLIIIFIATLLGIFLFLIILKPSSNPFVKHSVSYSDTLSEDEKSTLETYFNQHSPAADLSISARYLPAGDSISNQSAIYSVLLPVGGFYNSQISIDTSELDSLAKNPDLILSDSSKITPTDEHIYLLPADKLSFNVKLLAVGDDYYLDNATKANPKGAILRVLDITSDNHDIAAKTATELTDEFAATDRLDNILTFIQTGVTALTRQMQTKLKATGDASLFAAKIADFLKSADYTHTSNEVSFADDCDNNRDMAFCADNRMFTVLQDSGINIVELTGNHNNDWGASSNRDTIDFYHQNNIKTVGGGKDEEDAKTPLRISDKNTNITMIAVNNSTSTKANGQGASGDHPGANIYDENTTINQIKEAKENGDFVIVDIQFFECYSYPDDGEEMPSCDLPISGQEEFFKHLADAGADLIIGTQAHQPQTYELYKNTPIYYGLGNLFFDQIQWPGTSRSLVLTHYFKDGNLLQTKVTPTMYDSNFQTAIMDDASAKRYINRLMSYYQ